MAYAIVTKYLGPTDTRGSRVKAICGAGHVTIPYDSSLNSEGAHAKAAKALARRLGWFGPWLSATMPDDKGYCFVHGGNFRDSAFIVEIDP